MDRAKVSVIVPAYNCESYIGATLGSLLAQTLQGVQIICVDDCSTDKTPEIIAQKARQNENIVFIRLPQNRGVACARNEGLKHASAEFIMFCDGDDQYHEDMFRQMYEAMLSSGADLAAAQAEVRYDIPATDELKKADEKYFSLKYSGMQSVSVDLFLNTDVCIWDKIFKKSIIDEYQISFPEGLLYEDLYFTMAYLAASKNMFFLKRPLYFYYRRKGSIMSKTFEDGRTAIDHIFIMFRLYDFLDRISAVRKYSGLFPKLFLSYYNLAVRFSPKDARQKIWQTSRDFIIERGLLKKFRNSLRIKSIYENRPNLTFAEKIFSAKNSWDLKYKIITIFGLGIKVRRNLKK